MGSSITRAVMNFNVESRAHRLIGKEKLAAAPLHPRTKEKVAELISSHPEIKEKVYKKDDELLSRLKEVYVDSTDPSSEVNQDGQDGLSPKPDEFRSPKHTMNNSFLNIDVDNIPKGKISIIEVLTALNNHKISPQTWTSEKTATEYNLDIKDARALLEYFKIFEMKIIEPEEKKKISAK